MGTSLVDLVALVDPVAEHVDLLEQVVDHCRVGRFADAAVQDSNFFLAVPIYICVRNSDELLTA